MAATTMMTLSGSGVAGAQLSTSAASGASSQAPQQKGAVRLSTTTAKVVAVRATCNDDGRSSKTPQSMLVTLAAAGAALALTAAGPVSPAHAGLFGGGDAKVERAAAAPEFPGNEGTGTKVGDNSSERNAASSGTPLGEAVNNTVADASATVADAVETGIDIIIDPLKTKISDINPFKDTLNPMKSGE